MNVETAALSPELINKTDRYRKLKKLDDYFHGEQYEGRPDFWKGTKSGGEVVPLRERAPCIVYPLPKAAVNQATRFTLGEGRFPTIKAQPVEVSDGLKLSEEEAETLTNYIARLVDQLRLKPKMRTMMRRGLSARTAVSTVSLRSGIFHLDIPHARDCWPTFTDGVVGDVEKLTICYEYPKLVVKNGEVKYEQHWYRRDVTDSQYVVFNDVPVERGTRQIRWTIDAARTVDHGLGFCPVVWSRNLPDPYSDDIDGTSLYDGLLDEFDSLNFALSQRHRGIVYFGVPQPWETGVREGDGPRATGRTAMPMRGDKVDPFHVEAAPARKAAPDQMWSYENAEARLGLMETTGKAFDSATKHVSDVRDRLLEAMDIVLLDQMKVTGNGDISAKALALMYAPLLALVDELRECWWDDGLRRIISSALRIVATTNGDGILLPDSKKVAGILSRFMVDGVWVCPKLIPAWGDYFSPLNSEIRDAVDAANAALAGGIVQQSTAARYVSEYFHVDDIDAEMEAVNKQMMEIREQARNAVREVTAGPLPGEGVDKGGPKKPPKAPAPKEEKPEDE